MIGLLRADILRLRGRKDIALVVAAILVIHAIVFFQAFSIAKADVDVVTSVPPPPDAAEEFVRTQQQYRVAALAGFAVPGSVSLLMRPGFPVLPIGMAFLAVIVMGSDFDWGTVRGGVLLAGSRRRFILVRHVTIWAITAVTALGLTVLGFIAPEILTVSGAPVGWSGQSVLPALATIGLTAFQSAVYASTALAVTVVARSLGGGMIGVLLLVGADTLLNPMLRNQPALAKLTISGSLNDLTDPRGATALVVSTVVAILWLATGVAVSLLAMERRDIVE